MNTDRLKKFEKLKVDTIRLK